jgi:AcrR family transcriptional regulator
VSEPEKKVTPAPGGLSERQERALLAVVTHATPREAAKAAGVSEATLWRYRRNKEFAGRLREARSAMSDHTITLLQKASVEAVNFLSSLVGRDDAPWQPRVSAARAIVDLSFRGRVIDDLQAEVDRARELVGEAARDMGPEEGR